MKDITKSLKKLSDISSNLEKVKDKLDSQLISNDQLNVYILQEKLTSAINELNDLIIENANSLNDIKNSQEN